jgi:hypothetical protein
MFIGALAQLNHYFIDCVYTIHIIYLYIKL